MKKFGFLVLLLIGFSINADAQKSPRLNASETFSGNTITVDYGAPSVKGREIWGGLEKWGAVWRAGANKNTTITFTKNVTIDGKNLNPGTYGFFIIPNKKGEWVAIFSNTNDAWGAYSYKQSEDALRVKITPDFAKENQEQLKFSVTAKTIEFAWEKARLSIPWATN